MTNNKRPQIALIYDFDGTLAPGNMQEFGFIQAIGDDIEQFWAKCNKLADKNDANHILTYMYTMLNEARADGISLKRKSFKKFGAMVKLFPGVEQWFALINKVGDDLGLDVKHYINSSGLREMIEGTPIYHEFEQVYSSTYLYDVDGVAYWPGVAVDCTAKTQFIFKIARGIKEVGDTMKVNEYMPKEEQPVQYHHMIYFGDGLTDVPSMQLVRHFGGHSVAVYADDSCKPKAQKLIEQDHVDFIAKADYTEGSEIYNLVKSMLKKMKADHDFAQLKQTHKENSK
ncbi:MAG: haloacid dehalogenase-like hydrolase [Bacteroidales bacterium]|nr:haloacid dehalogenase-like hydrolase [Bacteroidales bacterium]